MLNVVQTKYGKVSGVHGNNAAIMVFKGVPYAAPPVGNLRFRPPVEPECWEGVLACDRFPKIGLQERPLEGTPFADFFHKEFYPYQPQQSEDCLYMNIWTPAQSADEKLPVMMWIHGGGLAAGYGHEMEFDGEALAKKGVILITINYRLGNIGFFAHPQLSAENEHGVSGNNVILDQLMALQWIHENIAAFGGDPDNVTVFGQSGGAGATRALLTTPLAEGLFHKAIIQSGISGMDQTDPEKTSLAAAEDWGVKALEILGMTLEELLEVPEDKLYDLLKYAEDHGAGRTPGIVRDGYVFPIHPAQAAASGQLHKFPIMAGNVCGDDNIVLFDFPGTREERLAHIYAAKDDKEFMAAYPEKDNMGLYDFMDENKGFYGMMSFGEKQSRHDQLLPYLYYFDAWMPGKNDYGFIPDGQAYHSAELWFVFGTLPRCWRSFDGRYYDLADHIQTYWTNFAKTGNPNGDNLPIWKPYVPGERCIMHMNENVCGSKAHKEKEFDTIMDFINN